MGQKKPPQLRAALGCPLPVCLRRVRDCAGTRDLTDGDSLTLRVKLGIELAGHRVNGLHVVGRANQ